MQIFKQSVCAAMLMSLVACGSSNPFTTEEEAAEEEAETETVTGIFGDNPPPGTAEPTRTSGIVRSEPTDDEGSGVATGFVYNSDDDTFFVDNLGFDGENTYVRDSQVATLQTSGDAIHAIYENEATVTDPENGNPVTQFTHKALYGVSTKRNADNEPTVSFAIVRTGGYVQYGFGGFVYQRNTAANTPSSGQATYTGDYSGLRDFDGRSGLEYVAGDMRMNVDFNDTNSNFAVSGSITNRRLFDLNGNDQTDDYTFQLGEVYESTYTSLPVVRFVLTADGNMDSAGESTGQLVSSIVDGDGVTQTLETGNYYALLGGESGEEMVGIAVITSDDPRYEGVTVRETGGFILVR